MLVVGEGFAETGSLWLMVTQQAFSMAVRSFLQNPAGIPTSSSSLKLLQLAKLPLLNSIVASGIKSSPSQNSQGSISSSCGGKAAAADGSQQQMSSIISRSTEHWKGVRLGAMLMMRSHVARAPPPKSTTFVPVTHPCS